MNYYELTCLISPSFSEEETKEISEKIKNFIEKESGSLEKTILPLKNTLGYSVKTTKRVPLIVSNFRLEPGKIENLEKKLKSENQILRYIILSKKIHKENPLKESLFKKSTEKYKHSLPQVKNKKVELKEIDKKIEEILNE